MSLKLCCPWCGEVLKAKYAKKEPGMKEAVIVFCSDCATEWCYPLKNGEVEEC